MTAFRDTIVATRKLLATTAGTVSAPLTAGAFLPGNGRRYRLTVSAPPTDPIYLGFGRDAVVGTGLKIPAGVAPVCLRLEDLGDALTGVISIIGGGAGAQSVAYLEGVLQET